MIGSWTTFHGAPEIWIIPSPEYSLRGSGVEHIWVRVKNVYSAGDGWRVRYSIIILAAGAAPSFPSAALAQIPQNLQYRHHSRLLIR